MYKVFGVCVKYFWNFFWSVNINLLIVGLN